MSDLTWTDIVAFVQAVHEREGAKPNHDLYRVLGRQGLAIISEQSRCVAATWTNAAGGTLTLTGATAPLPADCVMVTAVEWGGNTLERTAAGGSGWGTEAGNPAGYVVEGNSVVLDSIPSSTGPLVVYGWGSLPDFSDDPSDPNPLAFIPKRFQINPAYYILGHLPAVAKPLITDDGKLLGMDKTELDRQARYMALWDVELPQVVAAMERRTLERFTTGLGGLEEGV
jgi:hypothetical protein